MQVFKFGGASVKDAAAIRNLTEIVREHEAAELLIVVSAIDKTTNQLEKLTKAYLAQNDLVNDIFTSIRNFHQRIMLELFTAGEPVFDEVENTFVEIEWLIEEEPHDDADFIYDQIVSVGELVSSRIVTAYLNKAGVKSRWVDARSYIQTDNTYREAQVSWDLTRQNIESNIPQMLQKETLVTQGFIGGTSENYSTTLGREGSDYSAAIFAACLNAAAITIWKDVAGVFNADPKQFKDVVKFDRLSYDEATEMAYYGASIIHPKTIRPLQLQNITLFVKPFLSPAEAGTQIEAQPILISTPVIIVKQNQLLVSVSAKDHSFITENHLKEVFEVLGKLHLKVNMMQNSALSFSFCLDDDAARFERLRDMLQVQFDLKYNQNAKLITVRHYNASILDDLTKGKLILLEQLSRSTAQVLIKAEN